jgi:hypothetical protein
MEPRLTIVTLGVSDLDRSVRFYRDGLGLPVRDAFPDAVFFQMGGVRLGLYPRQLLANDANVAAQGSGFTGITLAHNVRTRDAVHRVLDEALAAGGRIVQPPRGWPTGAVTRVTSPTRMDTCGKLPAHPTARSTERTQPSAPSMWLYGRARGR